MDIFSQIHGLSQLSKTRGNHVSKCREMIDDDGDDDGNGDDDDDDDGDGVTESITQISGNSKLLPSFYSSLCGEIDTFA